MSVGAYGQTLPIYIESANISDMVDIYYTYHRTRSYDTMSSDNGVFEKLDSNCLQPCVRDDSDAADNKIAGMYTLQLPLDKFNNKGFYTVYIMPKEIEARITDIGTLTAFPDVRGIVINSSEIDNPYLSAKLKENNGIVGYRVVYLDDNGNRLPNYRIVTSNNKTEPVIQAPTSSSDKSYSYRYEDSSSWVFITVSPSSAPSFKANSVPYIGKPTQRILLVNTMFEPIMLDIEMETHNADTISYMLENDQLRDLDNGLITTYNDNGEIYQQSEVYSLKDAATGTPVYEVKKKRNNNVDFSQTITDK